MEALKLANLTGAVTALVFYVSSAIVFALRLAGIPRAGYWVGIFQLCLAVPLAYLLITAPSLERPALYYAQIALLLVWLAAELLLDYVLKIEFRHVMVLLIGYVVLFFAAGGGMIGVASMAGTGWSIAAIAAFLVSTALAFIQRLLTGM